MSMYGFQNEDKEDIYDAVKYYLRQRKTVCVDELIPEVLSAVSDAIRHALEERS